MVVMASEDIGNADRQALQLALNAALAYDRLGSTEGEIPLAQAVTTSLWPPSRMPPMPPGSGKASSSAAASACALHLRNAPTKLMKQMGYREGYRYAHDEPNGYAAGQTYFPEAWRGRAGISQRTGRRAQLGERLLGCARSMTRRCRGGRLTGRLRNRPIATSRTTG
jgi:putative ATPase